MIKNCLNCNKEFKTTMYFIEHGRGKHCSRDCANKTKSKLIPWNKDKHTGYAPWLGKIRINMQRENNPAWVGEAGKYSTKHNYVRAKLGRPKECKICGTQEKRMYHWANVSGEYKRDLNDWIRLCVPCHSKFDRERRYNYA